jgi:hypothetical protein
MFAKRKRSEIWNHFVVSESCKGKCVYCKKLISISGNTQSNLARHIKNVHPTITVGRQSVIQNDQSISDESPVLVTTSSTSGRNN